MATARRCEVSGCLNRISENSRLKQCQQCRGSRYYWFRRSPAQVLERRRKLSMWHARLLTFFTDNGKKVAEKKMEKKIVKELSDG